MSDDFENPLVSVIIPVYNAEKYIAKCINSLIEQTLQNFEVIVVNDGSTDSTPDILNKLAKEDSRIIVINQSNQKQGAARNRGLEIAKGKYITFVDADDWLDLDYLERMYQAIIEDKADIAVSGLVREYTNSYKYYLKYEEKQVFRDISDVIKICKFPSKGYVCGKLFSADLIKGLRFKENVYYEDTAFLIRAFGSTKTLVTVPEILYHYFSNKSSTVKSAQSKKKFHDRIRSALEVMEFAAQQNITLPNLLIAKERKFLSTIKYYRDRIVYYYLGIKVYVKHINFEQYVDKLLEN